MPEVLILQGWGKKKIQIGWTEMLASADPLEHSRTGMAFQRYPRLGQGSQTFFSLLTLYAALRVGCIYTFLCPSPRETTSHVANPN